MSASVFSLEWFEKQTDPEDRRVAVQRLGGRRGTEAVALIIRALGDEDWRVRKEAVLVVAAIEPLDDVIAALVRALDDPMNIGLRNSAVEALTAVGLQAVPATIAALNTLDPDGRKLAVEVLACVPDLEGTRALTRALNDSDSNVRAAAAEALRNSAVAGDMAREAAISALVRALGAPESVVRLAALDSLAHLNAELPWSLVEPLTHEPLLRRSALAVAANSGDDSAVVALAEAVGDRARTVARNALVALADRVLAREDSSPVVSLARPCLRGRPLAGELARSMASETEDIRARGAALVTLGILGDAADVSLLVDALGDSDVADRAEVGLRMFGEEALPNLVRVLETAEPRVRASVFPIAAALAPDEGASVDSLRDALRRATKEDADVVSGVMVSLGTIGLATDLEIVAGRVTDQDPRIAASAAAALGILVDRFPAQARSLVGQRDPSDADAVVACVILRVFAGNSTLNESDEAFLRRVIVQGDARGRRTAIEALSSVGRSAGEAIAFALADEDRDVQFTAMRALGKLKLPEPLETLASGSRDPAVLSACLRALAEADPRRALNAARPLVSSLDPALACAAVDVIGRIDDSERIDILCDALDHPDPEVVKVALSELAMSRDPRALTRLGLCLDHPSWEIRRLAAELIGQDRSHTARSMLKERYNLERDPVVRDAIAFAVSLRPPPTSFPEDP